ncbi:hypothetical protein PM3016_6935 [Paenibacillus mucilaginosus 3016]|uniref:MucB/RseB N-terminal domain-containing protein n=1 Tax=Paenibacillus mucilaginosus 3016 TaxID=1116391 RepID=H6NQR2_9BACL|nr:hypothetical protein [Paenibacillus mucilaginosus]AFC33530.1 hypothetical protein PM3016_6935 [Paenibacillus mucilaginosus 3016]WFA21933.1 hypothetical protein ERY13_34425 [Paenibacillus mucilaginosus]
MNERPSWYSRLRREPLTERTFTKDLRNKIEREIASRELGRGSRFGRGTRRMWAAGLIGAVLLLGGYGTVQLERERMAGEGGGSDFVIAKGWIQDGGQLPAPTGTLGGIVKKQGPDVPVFERMLNTMDYFTTVQGAYHVSEDRGKNEYVVEFTVDEGEVPGSSHKRLDGKTGQVYSITNFDGKVMLHMYLEEKRKGKPFYWIDDRLNKRTGEPPAGPRFYKDSQGMNNWSARGGKAWADGLDLVYPSYFAFWTVDEATMQPIFEITGTEPFLDREATIMEGKLDAYMGEKQGAERYKYWVDSETGVILKLLLTDRAGEPVTVMEMTEIRFDEPVDREVFSTKPQEGWTERKREFRNPEIEK